MRTDLDARILSTLAYADLFGDGVSEHLFLQRMFGAGEVHPEDLKHRLEVLASEGRVTRGADWIWRLGVGSRRHVAPDFAELGTRLRAARSWARTAGRLPFVRFIGLTGSLTKGDPGTDADYFVVAAKGRAYLAFLFLKSLGGLLAIRYRVRICVNFVVDEAHMSIPLRDAFTATEIVTMWVLHDVEGTGDRFWSENREWVARLCGNAAVPRVERLCRRGLFGRIVEACLAGAVGDRLDEAIRKWKQNRFIRRKGAAALVWPDVAFEPGFLKQHDASHRREILDRFRTKLTSLGLDTGWIEPAS